MEEDHEIEFIEEPLYDCNCPICLETFRDEVCQTTCCGNHICFECADRLKNTDTTCPICRNDNFNAIEDKFFTRMYLSLKVRCFFSKTGCLWTGELRQLQEHVRNCTKKLETRDQLSKHVPVTNERAITFSNQSIEARFEKGCSLNDEPSKGTIAVAMNESYETSIVPLSFKMTDYSRHFETGKPWFSPPFYTHKEGYKLNARVDANYNKISKELSVLVCVLKGEYDNQLDWPLHAEVKISLLNWRENESNITKFLYLPGDEFCKRLQIEGKAVWGKGVTDFASNEELEYIPSKNTQYLLNDCLSFRIENVKIFSNSSNLPKAPAWAERNCVSHFLLKSFERLKNTKSTQFYGPPFYTHEDGYKLTLVVYPNGYSIGAGTHVSIAAVLLKTAHDRTLNWPFSGELGIELINWREDRNHISCTLQFDENGLTEAISSRLENFVQHSQLMYNTSTNTEYLHNDCLLFKVTYAVAYSSPCSRSIPFWKQQQPLDNISALEFTLNKITIRSLYESHYYSKPFFASGYKMQVCVKASIDGYISINMQLLKGPNDSQLMWPFCGDVVVELLNWLEDKNHHRFVIEVSPRANSSGSAHDRNEGFGQAQFIRISNICDYFFNNDCFYFRIREVIVYSTNLCSKYPRWQSTNSLSPFGEFTMTNVLKRMEFNRTFYSPEFFTHLNGYKLCLEVQKSLKPQSIGLYARVMRGNNDNNLVWPLQASIVVELLNWRQNVSHYSCTLSFNELTPFESKSQVTKGECALSSCGTDAFILYASLGYNSITDTEYLQDDCLRFRIKEVIVYSSPLSFRKPLWESWLASNFIEHTITRFSERIRLRNVYWSPSFYSSARGYKMCLKVYPAGTGLGENSHVSIHCVLMKGEYDDELKWPFTADVVVDILNWMHDSHHHRVVLKVNEDSVHNSRTRVHQANELGHGWGNSKAIEFGSLFPTSSSPMQYLLDDCMRIRIHEIVIYSTQLLDKTPHWKGSMVRQPQPLAEFTVTGVTQHLLYNTEYISQPFYTDSNGFKLRLEVNFNGAYDEMKSYVSIHVRLLKGEFDNNLKWPMDVNLSIEVLNWNRNISHFIRTLKFSEGPMESRMPVVGNNEASYSSWGIQQFLPHTVLFTDTRAIQYVQDNCMCFRISIQASKGLLQYF